MQLSLLFSPSKCSAQKLFFSSYPLFTWTLHKFSSSFSSSPWSPPPPHTQSVSPNFSHGHEFECCGRPAVTDEDGGDKSTTQHIPGTRGNCRIAQQIKRAPSKVTEQKALLIGYRVLFILLPELINLNAIIWLNLGGGAPSEIVSHSILRILSLIAYNNSIEF